MFYRIGAGVVVAVALLIAGPSARSQVVENSARACADDNGGLTLSPGFCATIFADNLGHTRHLVVAPNGVVYVNTWSGLYYHFGKVPAGFLVALKDTKGDGHADVVERFGPSFAEGAAGGTGIAYYDGAIYAEEKDKIVRYALASGEIVPKGSPQIVVSGMPLGGDHPMHPFVIDPNGNLYVDMGSATNSCQEKNRTLDSPGIHPCTELLTRGGTWRFDANKRNQKFSPAERFVTGLRNGEGFAFDSAGRLFATQHGRDQLAQNFPKLFTSASRRQSARRRARDAEARRGFRLARMLFRRNGAKQTRALPGIRRRAERRSASARRNRSLWLSFRRIGRRMIC